MSEIILTKRLYSKSAELKENSTALGRVRKLLSVPVKKRKIKAIRTAAVANDVPATKIRKNLFRNLSVIETE